MSNSTDAALYFVQLPLFIASIEFADGALHRGADGAIYYTTGKHIFRKDHLGTSLKRRATMASRRLPAA